MLAGHWRGERLGACTDCRRLWGRYRAGDLSKEEIKEVEAGLCFTGGTCMVMGTASTMACLMETLGLMLPGGSSPPHASGQRLKHCVASGRCAVELARKNIRPKQILTRAAFVNAVKVLMALAGSTNTIVHLLAIARRAGVALSLDDFQAASEQVPVLVNCKPAGQKYMEDFHHAGGTPTLMKALESVLDPSAATITGKTVGQLLAEYSEPDDRQSVIQSMASPLRPPGGIAIVYGSLAPDGAVIKTAAASADLLHHRGPAVVFESPEDAAQRIDDPSLGITPQHVMVLRNAGPVGAGMPEVGSLPIPRYLAEQGVRDMVRVSDARMSGTAYGSIILHCAPEAAVGGPLALVQNGDPIEFNLTERRIDLDIGDDEMARRRSKYVAPSVPERGWKRLYAEHVLQANLGADLDFL